jgi:transcriptional regulator with XRE-family HTH domain
MVDTREVGRKFRTVRKETRLRRVDIAARAGVALSVIDLLEQGHRLPKIETLDRLAQVVGTSVSELLAPQRRLAAAA